MTTNTAEELLALRSANLDAAIRGLVKDGYRVIDRTADGASLVKPKKFSFIAFLLLLLVVGLGLIYLFWYLAKRDQTCYLSFDQDNNVVYTFGH